MFAHKNKGQPVELPCIPGESSPRFRDEKQPLESLVGLRSPEITPEFVNNLKAESYPDVFIPRAFRLPCK
jgi:hypothetical protein